MKNKLPIVLILVIACLVIVSTIITIKSGNKKSNSQPSNYNYFNNNGVEYQDYEASVSKEYEATLSENRFMPYEEGTELIPSKLYLTQETKNSLSKEPIYISLNNERIIIPVEICSSEDEERISYNNDELVIYKSRPVIDYKDYNLSYIVPNEKGLFEEDIQGLFFGFFALNDDDYIYRAFNTNIDNDETTEEVSFVTFVNNELKRVFAIDEGNQTHSYVAPIYIGNKIDGKEDYYYINKSNNNYSLEEIIDNCTIPFGYIKFTKKDGFVEENKLLDNTEIKNAKELFTGIVFTLSKDFNIKKYPIDGKYNDESGDSDNIISYYFTKGDSEEKLEKGTKFIVEKILDNSGNSIIRTEDGTLYILGNN